MGRKKITVSAPVKVNITDSSSPAQTVSVTLDNFTNANKDLEVATRTLEEATEKLMQSTEKFIKKVSKDGLDILGKMGKALELELDNTPSYNVVRRYRLKRKIANLLSTEAELEKIVNG